MTSHVSRKERRKQLEQQQLQKTLTKSLRIAGTVAAVGASTAPTLLNIKPIKVAADTYAETTSSNLSVVDQMVQHAKPIADSNGLYTSVMVAQALLESGWGESTLSQAPYHNLFGIKGKYQGKSVTMKTLEFVNGKYVTVNAAFRAYPSMKESFQDNAYVLKNTNFGSGPFYQGAWKTNTKSYKEATSYLQGRYATDPSYASKLNGIIQNYNLTKHDSGKSGGNSNNTVATQTITSYTVIAGDSLSKIAAKFGTSIANLKSWNKLSGDLIYVGQKLKVRSDSSTTTPSTTTKTQASSKNAYYTVKNGDSVWAISNAHGISMNQLVSWNSIKNNLIYPGQKLIVKKATNTSAVKTESNVPTTTQSKTTTYTVKNGDSVWAISNKYGLSMSQLISWNGIKNNLIYPGQVLKISSVTKTTSTTGQTKQTPSSTSNTATHTVKSGDTLWAISQSAGISLNNLKTLNNLHSDIIYVGQKLKLK